MDTPAQSPENPTGLRLVATLSRALVNLTSEGLQQGVEDSLRALGEACDHQRAYVFLLNEDESAIADAIEWVAEGTTGHDFDAFRGVSVTAFPWSMEQFLAGQTVIVEDPDALPEDAAPERGACELMAIRSYVNVPLSAGGALLGWLGFDATLAPIRWRQEQLELMQLASDVLASAFDRQRRQQALEAQREVSLRIKTVADLADGLAHDINNPLTWVLGNLDHFRQNLPALVAAGERRTMVELALDDARDGAARIRDVVQSLRALTRPDSEKPAPVRLEHVLDLTLRLANADLRYKVEVARQTDDLPAVIAQSATLGQVLLQLYSALARNLPHGHADRHQLLLHATAGAKRVELAMSVRPRDPEKPALSRISASSQILARCRAAVASFNGLIELCGEASKQEVVLTLRRADVLWPEDVPTASERNGFGRVLVVDDEVAFLRWTKAALHRDEVTVASSAGEAMATLRGAEAFDLVLLDVMMPDCTGPELFAKMVQEKPEIADRTLFITAGVIGDDIAALIERAGRPLVTKPFGVAELRRALAS